jgi:preprotein translocase subunit SecA
MLETGFAQDALRALNQFIHILTLLRVQVLFRRDKTYILLDSNVIGDQDTFLVIEYHLPAETTSKLN